MHILIDAIVELRILSTNGNIRSGTNILTQHKFSVWHEHLEFAQPFCIVSMHCLRLFFSHPGTFYYLTSLVNTRDRLVLEDYVPLLIWSRISTLYAVKIPQHQQNLFLSLKDKLKKSKNKVTTVG
jgi:hypothetical protein